MAWRQEANIFTDAELHVHSVSVIAYSVLAGLGMAVSSLLLREMLSAKAFAYSTVATQIGTLIILCLVRAAVPWRPCRCPHLISGLQACVRTVWATPIQRATWVWRRAPCRVPTTPLASRTRWRGWYRRSCASQQAPRSSIGRSRFEPTSLRALCAHTTRREA